jgi:hypothetical protein
MQFRLGRLPLGAHSDRAEWFNAAEHRIGRRDVVTADPRRAAGEAEIDYTPACHLKLGGVLQLSLLEFFKSSGLL